MNATPSPRRSSPSAPDSLAGGPEAVAGNGSSPAGNGSPLAGKRVIDNSNTSAHVPQHARQLFGSPGDGGRSRVFAGRISGLRRPEIGSSIPGLHIGPRAPARPATFRASRRRWPESGLRRPEIGSSPAGNRVFDTGATYRAIHSPHLFPHAQHPPHPWQARGHLPPGPPQDQAGGTPLKSNKCHWSSSRGRHY